MQEIIKKALSYDDVLLMPRFSTIVSRKDVDTSSQLTSKLKLEIPIISSNMDTVTESSMAIAMARMGGIGIIHRYMTTDDQIKEVLKVKRAEAIFIERPYTLNVDLKLQDAIDLMDHKKITGIPIVDEVGRFVGILTNRDLMFENNLNKPIKDLMTPKGKAITAPFGIDIETAKTILKEHKVEKLPLIDKNGILKGLITLKDIMNKEKYPNASKDSKGRLLVGGAIGVRGDYLERAEALIEANCDVLVIDIAHGHHENMLKTIRALRDKFGNVQLIAGNVATGRGTEELIKAGADAIKVGVGGGCFAANTRVLMANGTYKNIEDIKAGERVINKDGFPVNVKKSFCTGIKKVNKIRSSIFYEPTYVTPNHNYFIGDLNSVSNSTLQSRGYANLLQVQSKTVPKMSKYKWKEAQYLKQDALLMPREINFELKTTFEINLKKCNGGNWRTGFNYEIDNVLKPNYELGYIFGTFLGDGSAHTAIIRDNSKIGSVRWYFGRNEIDIANKLIKCIVNNFDKEAKLYYKKNIIQVILYYKPFADFLQRFKKKSEKELPEEYLVKDRDYLNGLLDGLIDSDGNVEKSGRIRFTNTSKKLIELFNIVNYLLTGVFPNNLKREIKIGNLINANIENFNIGYVSEIINTGEKILTQDYQIAKLLANESTDIFTEVYDLEIDCPTHSFIANNAIVHNSICVTRIVTGFGVPQLSAILDSARVAKDYGIPIIADGGIKQPGDITKALAAGASTVMLGNLLAGTDESPGQTIIKDGRKFKVYRGMAGFGANMSKRERDGADKDLSDVVPEGIEGKVPYRGSVNEVVYQLIGGYRSGLSYAGAKNINELWNNAEFVEITQAGLRESHAHDIDKI